MKKLNKNLFISLLFFIAGMNIQAQDTIRLQWMRGYTLAITTNATGTIKVDWGDGKTSSNSGGSRSFNSNYSQEDFYNVTITTSVGCKIERLICQYQRVYSIDFSKAVSLRHIFCSSNYLLTLDVSKNTLLQSLSCENNQLSMLDVTQNTQLNSLYAFNNKINKLKVAGPISSLNCDNNELSLQIIKDSIYPLLGASAQNSFFNQQRFQVSRHDIAVGSPVDFNAYLLTSGNTIFTLAINGKAAILNTDYTENNGIITFLSKGTYSVQIRNDFFTETDPPYISTQILVDPDIQSIKFTWDDVDPGYTHNIYMRILPNSDLFVDWGDNTTERFHSKSSGEISLEKKYIKQGTYNVTISSLNEINAFQLSNERVTFLDVSKCLYLEEIACYDNLLTSINLSNMPYLRSFELSYNKLLAELNLSGCSSLQYISIYNLPSLRKLDLTGCTEISSVSIYETQIDSLDFSTLSNLQTFSLGLVNNLSWINLDGLNQLSYLNLQNLPKLKQLEVNNCAILNGVNLYECGIESFKASNCPVFDHLSSYKIPLSNLDLSGVPSLKGLSCDYVKLDSLDLSSCINLENLYINNSKITYLSLGNNSVISSIDLSNNFYSQLDSIYTFIQRYPSATGNIRFNNQLYQNPIMGYRSVPIDYSDQDTVNLVPTTFAVYKKGIQLIEGTDYTITEGQITFLSAGVFVVQMTNSKLPPGTVVESNVLIETTEEQLLFTWNADSKTRKEFVFTATKGKFTLDWGDGTTDEYVITQAIQTISPNKTYLSNGSYTVSLTSNNGSGFINLSLRNQNVTDIDVQNASSLIELSCENNLLTTLDVSGALSLQNLNCENNQLETLLLNASLESLRCSNNFLSSFTDLFALQQQVLNNVSFGDQHYKNRYTIPVGGSVDFSSQLIIEGALSTFEVYKYNLDQALEGIDYTLSNGIISFLIKGAYLVKIQNNTKLAPNTSVWSAVLTGISSQPQKISFLWEVTPWNVIYKAEKNVSLSYEWGTFTIDWGNGVVDTLGNNKGDGIGISKLYDSVGQYRVTITGDSSAIFKYISIGNNDISSIDVSDCWGLTEIYVNQNKLTDLNISGCTSLSHLYCDENQLTSLDLSSCTNLMNLYCERNQLTSLDLSNLKNLTQVSCRRNQLLNLQLPENSTVYLNAQENRLALDSMYTLTKKISNPSQVYLEWQVVENPVQLAVNQTRSYDNVAPVLNGINTTFEIYKNEIPAIEGAEYTLVGTDITFHKEGMYTIQLQNTAILSGDTPYGVSTAIVGNPPVNEIEMKTDLDLNSIYRYFNVSVTKGVDFSVDWGDGNIETAVGEGVNNPVYRQHAYNYPSNNYTVKIKTKGSLAKLNIQYGDIKSLNILACPSLTELECQNNMLTQLDISHNPLLGLIRCQDNFLPFSELLKISNAISNVNNKYIGNQHIRSKDYILEEVGQTTDYSSQLNFTNLNNTTSYSINRGVVSSVAGTDYTLQNGVLSFLRLGSYEVSFTNNAITSNPSYPAKVLENVRVRLSDNATLKALAVNGVSLPLTEGMYHYYINFSNNTATAFFSTETSSPGAVIISKLDPLSLQVGINIQNIIVRAQDGTVQYYTVEIIRRSVTPNTDATLQSLSVSNANLVFSPTVYDYNVTVGYDVNIVTITPRLSNKNTIIVGGNLDEGTNLKVLQVGINIFTIKVVSENASDTLTYTLYITRSQPDATLKSLTLNGEALTLIPEVYAYLFDVCPGTTSVLIEAEPNNSGATVNGTGNKPVITRNNTFELLVTSAEGLAKQIYVITINSYAPLAGGKIGNSKTVCYNSVVTDIISSEAASGGKGFYQYQWQSSINQTQWNDIVGATNEVYCQTENILKTTYFRRQVKDSLCGLAYSDTLTFSVFDSLTGGTVGSNQSICGNAVPEPFTSLESPTGGAGLLAYQWQLSFDSIQWTSINGATLDTYSESNALIHTTYYRRAVYNGSCDTAYSNVITITLTTSSLAGITGPNSVCTVSEEITYATEPGKLNYRWTLSGGIISSGQGTDTITVQWQTEGNHILTVNYNQSAECTAETAGELIVTVSSLVEILSISSPLVMCEGDQLNLKVSVKGHVIRYQWYFNGVPLENENDSILSIASVRHDQSGNYYVMVEGSCGGVQSSLIQVEVSLKNILVRKWNDVILVDNSSGEYMSYQWYHNGVKIEGATRQFYQETGGLKGTYSVELIRKDGTITYSCDTTFTLAKKGMLTLYPVPVKTGTPVQVLYDNEFENLPDVIHFELFDATGKTIHKGQSKTSMFTIFTEELNPGIYLLQIITQKGEVFNEKIVVN